MQTGKQSKPPFDEIIRSKGLMSTRADLTSIMRSSYTILRHKPTSQLHPGQTPPSSKYEVYLRATWNALLNRNDSCSSAGETTLEPPRASGGGRRRSACKSINVVTNHESSQLQVRGLVGGDRVDLYRFKVTRDSAVHLVAFFPRRGDEGKGVACLGFGLDLGWIRRYFKEHFAFRFGRGRLGFCLRSPCDLILFSLLLTNLPACFCLCHFTIAIIVLSITLVYEQHKQHDQYARLHPHRRPPGPGRRSERDQQLCFQHQL